MTFEKIQQANNLISTTDIKGKDYAEVNQRIKAFRFLYPKGKITTEMLSLDNGVAVFKATVSDEKGVVLGQGHAYEKENSTFINKTSFIENCETSAVGRALAMCGIGIDTSVASFEEVANAIENQKGNTKDTVEEKTSDIKCPKCGNVIKKMTTAKGNVWEPQDILERYGMCRECYKAGQQ